MGNQPSGPSPQNNNGAQPVVEICDLKCQKQKNLALLKLALDNTNQESEPEKYEQARIAYYSELYGSSWLEKDKEERASDELKPIITDYTTKYNELKDEKDSQKAFTSLASLLNSQLEQDKEDNSFLDKQYKKEKSHTETLLRQNQLSGTKNLFSFSWLFNLLCGLLVIGIIYLGFTKLDKIKTLIFPAPSVI
jgi:hypothetical protein